MVLGEKRHGDVWKAKTLSEEKICEIDVGEVRG